MGINTKHSDKNYTKHIIILLFVKYTIYAFGCVRKRRNYTDYRCVV